LRGLTGHNRVYPYSGITRAGTSVAQEERECRHHRSLTTAAAREAGKEPFPLCSFFCFLPPAPPVRQFENAAYQKETLCPCFMPSEWLSSSPYAARQPLSERLPVSLMPR